MPDMLALAQDANVIEGAYPVYTGPGEQSFRITDATFTGGAAKVYGKAGDWALITYGLPDGSYHAGYVSIAAIPAEIPVGDLTFTAAPMTVRITSVFTDDPIAGSAPLAQFEAGQQVTVLATMGNWIYVEAANFLGSGLPARGFIDISAFQ